MVLAVAVIVALLTAYQLYTFLFKDWDEFSECLLFWFTPDLWSLLRGQLHKDLWAEFKLLLWIAGVFSMGFSVYQALK